MAKGRRVDGRKEKRVLPPGLDRGVRTNPTLSLSPVRAQVDVGSC